MNEIVGKIMDEHLDKLLAFCLVLVFITALLIGIHWDQQNEKLMNVLESGLDYASGLFSALMLPGGLSLLKKRNQDAQ